MQKSLTYSIVIPEGMEEAVRKQVDKMHDIALHNLGNTQVRGGDVQRDLKVAQATLIVHDIIKTVLGCQEHERNGDDPEDSDYGTNYIQYVSIE